MWIDPHTAGVYAGQCAQYCGTQHAKMLLRVYVDSRQDFDRWVDAQRQPAVLSAATTEGARVFQTTACVNCHTVTGTPAVGRFGPDLTHLMSRDTIGAGVTPNTAMNLRKWTHDPDVTKPGSRMPAMRLSEPDLDAVTEYLTSLR
jgi:cytochrome c oxidase subunit II